MGETDDIIAPARDVTTAQEKKPSPVPPDDTRKVAERVEGLYGVTMPTLTLDMMRDEQRQQLQALQEQRAQAKALQQTLREWAMTPSAALGALLGSAVAFAWAAEELKSSALLGAFLAGTIFCSMGRAREAWSAVAPVQAWLARLFFGATVAFTIPVDALLSPSSLGDGLLLTVAAILGKFLSGLWAEP